MAFEKRHFLEFNFPSAGMFYADTHCKVPLFIGQLEIQEDTVRIKVLERQKDEDSYRGILYARLKTSINHYNIVSWSFFDCHFNRMQNVIEFSSFVKHDNNNTRGLEEQPQDRDIDKDTVPKFVTQDNKFKRISVKIESLDKWLWKQPFDAILKEDFQFGFKFIDKNGKLHRGYRVPNKTGGCQFNTDITHMIIPTHMIEESIVIDEELSIELHSTPGEFGEYPNFQFWQDSYIDIVFQTPKPMNCFYSVIYKLTSYFTSIGFRKCKVHSIYFHETASLLKDNKSEPPKLLNFYHNGLCWDLMKKKYNEWFTREKLSYHSMQGDFKNSLKLFFAKQDSLHNIINFLSDMEDRFNKGYLEVYIIQQIQLLETYGNMKLKGEYVKNKEKKMSRSETKQDLDKAITLLPDKIFDQIFIHNYPGNPYRGREIFGYESKDKPIKELKELLRVIIIELRNFIVHPYRMGRHKELKDTQLPQLYYSDDALNAQAISSLSHSINMMLRWFFFEEIGLKEYFEV